MVKASSLARIISIPVIGAISGILLLTGIASAHVDADPGQVAKGDDGVIGIRVPNEEENAGVVKVELTFPQDHPIAEVATTPVAGWTVQVSRIQLAKPVHQNNADVVQAVSAVTWTAQPGTQIAPGEYLTFSVLAGPIPADTDQLILPAIQTYNNGDVVKWDAPPAAAGSAEPEYPAPVVHLVSTSDTSVPSAPAGADGTARWLGGAGLVLGAAALLVAALVLIRTRRSRPADSGDGP